MPLRWPREIQNDELSAYQRARPKAHTVAQRSLVLFQLLLQAKIFFAKQSHLIHAAKPRYVDAPKGLRCRGCSRSIFIAYCRDPLSRRTSPAPALPSSVVEPIWVKS
jgi:hypothetical protein